MLLKKFLLWCSKAVDKEKVKYSTIRPKKKKKKKSHFTNTHVYRIISIKPQNMQFYDFRVSFPSPIK